MRSVGWVLVFFFLFAFVTLGFFAIVLSETSISEEKYNEVVESEQYYKDEYEKIITKNKELENKANEATLKYNEIINSKEYKRALYAEELDAIIFNSEQRIKKYEEKLGVFEGTTIYIRGTNASIEIPKLPVQVSYFSSGEKITTLQINNISCNGEMNFDGTIDLSFYFSGEVVYSSNKEGEAEPCRFDCVLYDSNNNTLERERAILGWHVEGDSFFDEECYIYDIKYDDEYFLKLFDDN